MCNAKGLCGCRHRTVGGSAGAERLRGWRDQHMDGSALEALHDGACAELAEGAALCMEALHTFGICTCCEMYFVTPSHKRRCACRC